MADAVTTDVLVDTSKHYAIHMTNICDGTGEAAVVKIDVSTLVGPQNGAAPTTVSIEKICWDIQGFTNVRLLWDATTDDVAVIMSGQGFTNWKDVGGLHNPNSSGVTGDLVLTTVGDTSGDTYDITIWCKKEA